MNGHASPGNASRAPPGAPVGEDLRAENGRLRKRLEDADRRSAAAAAAQVGGT